MTLSIGTLLQYYKRSDIQQAILACAGNKEVAIKYGDKGYGKRPDVLSYPNDVIELVKNGATSFHASEELWRNPLQLDPMLRKADLDEMRIGWDLVLDIDCPVLEYSKLGSHFIVKALQHHGISSLTVKFSGNHGFHIGVPFEAFPEFIPDKLTGQMKETRLLFPEGPRRIALHIKEMIKKKLAEAFLEKYDVHDIAKSCDRNFKELVKDNQLDPFEILDIDTILISSRHLYRMPYSFNEKSGLISVPIDPNHILKFNKEDAVPNIVTVSRYRFLDRTAAKPGEANKLIVQAFDSSTKTEEPKRFGHGSGPKREYDIPQSALPEQCFPPCITNILKGMDDGKKRAMFVLVNFLTNVGWDHEKIEALLHEWNKKNKEPLRENIIVSHTRYHKDNKKTILPPNCDNSMYYKDLRICTPDNLCQKVSNPVNYSRRKTKYLNREEEPKKLKRRKHKEETEAPAAEKKDTAPAPADSQPVGTDSADDDISQ